jgi:hypothetical protein
MEIKVERLPMDQYQNHDKSQSEKGRGLEKS